MVETRKFCHHRLNQSFFFRVYILILCFSFLIEHYSWPPRTVLNFYFVLCSLICQKIFATMSSVSRKMQKPMKQIQCMTILDLNNLFENSNFICKKLLAPEGKSCVGVYWWIIPKVFYLNRIIWFNLIGIRSTNNVKFSVVDQLITFSLRVAELKGSYQKWEFEMTL